jgi:hypothetical protein
MKLCGRQIAVIFFGVLTIVAFVCYVFPLTLTEMERIWTVTIGAMGLFYTLWAKLSETERKKRRQIAKDLADWIPKTGLIVYDRGNMHACTESNPTET